MDKNRRVYAFMTGRLLILAILLITLSLPASAEPTFSFEGITSNTPSGSLLPSIEMTVQSYGSDGVLFTFGMTGPGSITEIYFEDSAFLSGPKMIDNNASVSFKGTKKLLGAKGIKDSFQANKSLSLQASKKKTTGIRDGGTLSVVYSLKNGMSYDEVLDALVLGDIQVGMQLRYLGLKGKQTDFFCSIANLNLGEATLNRAYAPIPAINPVPAPGALLLGGTGLMFVGWLRRRKAI